MKYLMIILSIVVCSSMVSLFYLLPSNSSPAADVALHVNGHPITNKNIDEQGRTQGYHSVNREGDIDSLVTKQLLIDEAQRLGLDKREDFRMALKNYYEQTLVAVLTDYKLASLEVKIGEQDIERYLAGSGKHFIFTQIPLGKGGEPLEEQGRQNRVLFDDLSESLRLLLTTIQPGEEVRQFETGTEVSIIRLDKVEAIGTFAPIQYDRDRVRELLQNYRESLEMGRWIKNLREKSSISVSGEEG